MPTLKSTVFRLAPALVLAAATAVAHYTWVAPPSASLEVGKTAKIAVNHGHKFPVSEEAINAAQVELYVLAPSGARVKLTPTRAAGHLAADYSVKETGLHRIVMVQDRGITSRTPKGVQPGGKDKNPDATQSSRTWRSAVTYVSTAKAAAAKPKPVGLEFELVGEYANGAWQLTLLRQGKAVANTPVEVFLSGASAAAPAGKTGPHGQLTYRPSGKGPAMFSVEIKDPPPARAPYDAVNYSTSLYVNW